MGHNEQDVFIAFANTSKKTATEHITLNAAVIPWSQDRLYAVVAYDKNGKPKNGTMKNGTLSVTLPTGGFSCLQIKGIYPKVSKASELAVPPNNSNKMLRYAAIEDSAATATAMIIQPNEKLAVFYVYCNKTEKDWKQCSLRYRLNESTPWTTIRDTAYPFEFEIMLPKTDDAVSFEITAIKQDGSTVHFPLQMINAATQQHAKKFTILGLGDSITEGGPEFFSYLFPLDSLLKQAGYEPNFIGPRRSIQNGDTLYHSGFSGKTAEFLAKSIDSIYTAFPADLVLLHAGHNHFKEEVPVPGIIQAQRTIIQTIKKKNPGALIFVAGVITSGKLPKYEYIPALNAALKAMVDALHDPTILFVDQQQHWEWSSYTISDKVHPNQTGARIIATNWFNAIVAMANKKY
jgi:lysophospholipase L1-like esterase